MMDTTDDGELAKRTLIDFNLANNEYAWKIAQPVNFKRFEHRSNYYNRTLLDFPIFFKDLPDISEKLYYPSYKYVPFTFQMPDRDVHNLFERIQTIIQTNYESCEDYSKSCELMNPQMRSHATSSCCGFTAPVFSVFLHEYTKFYKQNAGKKMTEELRKVIREKAVLVYQKFLGYGKSPEEFSWNNRCQGWANKLYENVNLLSFFTPPTRGTDGHFKCSTYHHFVVYIAPQFKQYSFIIDAWAGNERRGKWVRIMMTDHLSAVLDVITKSTDEIETNILINQYFVVPNSVDGLDLDLIKKKVIVGNISLDLEDRMIQQLYDEQHPIHKAFNKPNTMDTTGEGKRRKGRKSKKSKKLKAIVVKISKNTKRKK